MRLILTGLFVWNVPQMPFETLDAYPAALSVSRARGAIETEVVDQEHWRADVCWDSANLNHLKRDYAEPQRVPVSFQSAPLLTLRGTISLLPELSMLCSAKQHAPNYNAYSFLAGVETRLGISLSIDAGLGTGVVPSLDDIWAEAMLGLRATERSGELCEATDALVHDAFALSSTNISTPQGLLKHPSKGHTSPRLCHILKPASAYEFRRRASFSQMTLYELCLYLVRVCCSYCSLPYRATLVPRRQVSLSYATR